MELILLAILIIIGLLSVKLIGWFLKAGFFLITLPFKIAGAIIVGILAILLIPLLFFPVILIPLIPLLILVAVVIFLVKLAF